MREIKFRAWQIEDKFMFIPRRIDFPHFLIGDTAKWEVWYQFEDIDDSTPEHMPIEDISFYGDELILMQYTGLKDKNGKEIYEGDILKLGNTSSFVIWSLDGWRFNSYMERGNLNLYLYVDKTTKEIAEIIGNVHENPELLVVKER